MSGPLAGIRVIDLTTVIMGPYATQILGDLGADVIKIERPGGDSNRYLSPGRTPGMSGIALTLHRNKRSLMLDLKTERAQGVLRRLVKTSDILIHNMLPEVVRSLGLSYGELSKLNPSLIYCVATGFGNGGPYAGRPAYDDLIQGASGIASLMADGNGQPKYFPGILCDKVTGLAVVNAVLAAHIHRQHTGEGQEVTVPMFETMVAFNLVEHAADAIFVPAEGEVGYPRVLSEHRRPYRTKDGFICVLPYSDRDWTAFFSLLGRPALVQDPRFRTIADRTANIDALYGIVASSLDAETTEAWLEKFRNAGIAASAVRALSDIVQDRHIRETGFIRQREHPTQGLHKEIGVPIEFSISNPDRPKPAPMLGEHGEEILTELGYRPNEIAEICG